MSILENLIDSLPEKVIIPPHKDNGYKESQAGLCVRFSTSKNHWRVSYGRHSKDTGIGKTPIEAMNKFIDLQIKKKS